MNDPHAYNITVRRNDFEGDVCFEARVKEFPDLAEYGDSYEEVYELAIDAISTTVNILSDKGKGVPVPQNVPDDFSGRVTLRLPKSLHRSVALAAEEEGVSLNQHLVNVLSYFSGYAAGATTNNSDMWETVTDSVSGYIESREVVQLVCSNGAMSSGWKKTG